MIKTIGLMLAGSVLGGAAVYVALDSADAGSLAVYRDAAAIDDVETLAAMLERVLTAAPTAERDVGLDVLVARLATLAPERAARLAESRGLDDHFVATAYRYWGDADVSAALRALAAIEQPGARRAAALALLDIVGDDAAGAARVAAALPKAERPSFQADWLARRAVHAPEGAFGELLALSSRGVQRIAAERVAAAWGARDPERALAAASLLPEDLVADFRGDVLAEWARLDSAAVLAYLERGATAPVELAAALNYLIPSSPEAVLAAAERMPAPNALEIAALMFLAERDPLGVIDRVEAMPAGPERDQAVSMVAVSYALVDPEAAMSWVETMMPSSPNAQMSVALGLAERDPIRAFDLLSRRPASVETQMLLGAVVTLAAQEPGRAAALASELVPRNDGQSRSMLSNLISGWVQQDARSALDWILEQGSDLDATVLGITASSLANRDVALAADFLERIPSEFRDVWVTSMAGAYGRNDPAGGLDWIAQFAGEAVYEPAYSQLVMQAAISDPAAASRMLASASIDLQRSAASIVGASWARQDPAGAAAWALALPDPPARAAAVGGLARGWATTDAAAARAWVLQQPSGDARDEGLSALVVLSAEMGRIDSDLLAELSSDEAREQVLGRVVPVPARDEGDAETAPPPRSN